MVSVNTCFNIKGPQQKQSPLLLEQSLTSHKYLVQEFGLSHKIYCKFPTIILYYTNNCLPQKINVFITAKVLKVCFIILVTSGLSNSVFEYLSNPWPNKLKERGLPRVVIDFVL